MKYKKTEMEKVEVKVEQVNADLKDSVFLCPFNPQLNLSLNFNLNLNLN
jgi:hypothetical protein